ncbi:hypothetical protein BpHYR1_012004 [Brachionus plicatilis]|uniref:Uncharacterized protein n=1 Tax=Brachionus plicatilis TaxID=10195 RepID=A0A3M7QR81_BRAPC|nr:hypothetical protein BpHYR1_012004 [Brachionus plicatilis]
MAKSIFLIIFLVLQSQYSTAWNCSIGKNEAVELFKSKILTNQYPNFPNDPYLNQTEHSIQQINQTLSNKEIVCAIKYQDNDRIKYDIRNFQSASLAINNGYIVTHQGRCGACSSLNDLAIYLSVNLTAPARKCGMVATLSESNGLNCLKEIGFTDQCAQIWLFNTKNTRRECFGVCIMAWILNEPYTKPDGSLNNCLQCDEDKSGPVFKYYSGRTRRNSGIRKEIDRPTDEVYNITHCYY